MNTRYLPFARRSAVLLTAGLAAGIAAAQVTGPLDRSNTTVAGRATEAAAAAPAAVGQELVCRGGLNAFAVSRWEDAAAGISKMQLNFSHSTSAPGADGRGMQPGTCAWMNGVMAGSVLHQVNFVENPGGPTAQGRAASAAPAGSAVSITEHLNDPNRFWRFRIDGQQYGWYLASDHGPWQSSLNHQVTGGAASTADATQQQAASTALPPDLFEKDDREMVEIGGKSMTAGDLKRELQPDLDSLFRAPQTVSASRAAVAEGSAAGAVAAGATTSGSLQQIANPAAATVTGIGGAAGGGELEVAAGQRLNCDREPPGIGRIRGTVAPGAQVTLMGYCLGDQTGHVEALGQVPGGKLSLEVVLWRHDAIVVAVPALSGVADQNLAFTATRADGQQSAPLQAKFRVPRVHVEIPAYRWSPAATVDESLAQHPTQPQRREFRVAINPACALENMQATGSAGFIDSISGFENGPPHESSVVVVSRPGCTSTARWTRHSAPIVAIGDDLETSTVCRTSYSLTASGSCPAGISP